MSERLPTFLRRNEDSILFNNDEGYFAFYVPEFYFGENKRLAVITGETISLFGICDYAIFDKEGNAITDLKPFRFPTVFITQPAEVEKLKNVKLKSYMDNQDFRVLKYYKDDIIVASTKVPQDVVFIEDFYGMFLYAHLPATIRYDEIQNYFIENALLNGCNYKNIPVQLVGVCISELYRDPEDKSKPFRLSKNDSMTGYYMAGIKELPKLVSPYTSLTTENWDEGVMNAIMMDEGKESPLEIIFTR